MKRSQALECSATELYVSDCNSTRLTEKKDGTKSIEDNFVAWTVRYDDVGH